MRLIELEKKAGSTGNKLYQSQFTAKDNTRHAKKISVIYDAAH